MIDQICLATSPKQESKMCQLYSTANLTQEHSNIAFSSLIDSFKTYHITNALNGIENDNVRKSINTNSGFTVIRKR